MFTYTATVRKVVDGDTMHLTVDLGLDIYTNISVRLYGIDTPELPTSAGVAAREYVIEWLRPHQQRILVATFKDKREKFGRYLAEVFDLGRVDSLNELLVTNGHAVRYRP